VKHRWSPSLLQERLARLSASELARPRRNARSAASPRDPKIHAEQVRLLYEHLPTALVATTVISVLITWLFWGQVAQRWMVLWLAGMTVTTLGRWWLWRAYATVDPSNTAVDRWRTRFLIGVVASAVFWGIAGVFPVSPEGVIEQLFLPFVLAGLAAGGMVTMSAVRRTYPAFLLPMLVPFTAKILLQGGAVSVAMGALLILFMGLLLTMSRHHNRLVAESLWLRFENQELLDDLAAATDHFQAINLELEGQIEERKRTERALQESSRIYETLVETTATGYHISDSQGRILDANTVYVRMTGHQHLAEIQGRRSIEWTAPYDIERSERELDDCLTRQSIRNLEVDYVDANAHVVPIEINATVVRTGEGDRILYLSRDITERRSSERKLRRAYDDLEGTIKERTAQLARANEVLRTEKELFRVTLASIGDGVITTDSTGYVSYLNPAAERLLGQEHAEARTRPLLEIFQISDEGRPEPLVDPTSPLLRETEATEPGHSRSVLLKREQGELNVHLSVAPILDSDGVSHGTVLVFRDVTGERKLTQQLSYQATHDTLTGLVNRHEFERRLTHLLETASAAAPHALLYLDLDQFKVVNDTWGHAAGDDLLRQVSALLRTRLRARDTLARLGGDEFGVLLERCPALEAGRVGHTLRELLQDFRFVWNNKRLTVGVSIGVVPIAQGGETLAAVLSAADRSCYAAKEKGRNRVHLYQPDDAELAQREGEMHWMSRIQQALADDRFRLYYQPIVAFDAAFADRAHGEILIRMVDESGTVVSPGAFLPAAERYGLMPAVDRWVVRKSLETLAGPAYAGRDVMFDINISGQSLSGSDFLDFVAAEIDATKVAPQKLCFEITETSAVSELAHALRFIDTLKTRGCQFALDDFGTGLASFSYLKSLPVDYLKIDGAFVRGLVTDDVDHAMVEAVHRVGRIMSLKTIAECVENQAVLEKLKRIGIDYGQGYELGRPRPIMPIQRSAAN
jgi:diguanylate cyclase (GGDEF)-like protein/PAS domain S-box-containing protein